MWKAQQIYWFILEEKIKFKNKKIDFEFSKKCF